MTQQDNLRGGIAVGVTALAVLSAAAVGVIGIADHSDRVAQRDITLVSAVDWAQQDISEVPVGLDQNRLLDDVALQQSSYSWALESVANGDFGLPDDSLLFVGAADDPTEGLFNVSSSRFAEADLVDQALMQAQLDHLLGLNQGLDASGYASATDLQFFDDLSSGSMAPDSALSAGIANLIEPSALAGAGGFQETLLSVQGDLMQAAWAGLFGIFSVADVTP